jgi:hypothetical protein
MNMLSKGFWVIFREHALDQVRFEFIERDAPRTKE